MHTTHMPMMHPEDEANTDAPLVPDLRLRDRPPRENADPSRRDVEPLRLELATIRVRLDAIETRLTREFDPR